MAEVAASLPSDAALVAYFTYEQLLPPQAKETASSETIKAEEPVRSYLAFVLRAGERQERGRRSGNPRGPRSTNDSV
jgi:hypothetical protein